GIVGTPPYMSPEHVVAPERVDGRSDVYSLGVVLYELLTGETPFRGQTHLILQQVVMDEPRPPRRLNDAIPRDLETICLKAIAKAGEGRSAGAGAVAEDVRRFLKGEPIQARPVGKVERLWRWGRRNPALALATGLAAAALVAAAGVSISFGIYQSNAATRSREEEGKTKVALEESDKHRRQAEGLSASLSLEQALLLYQQADVCRGMVFLASALELSPADD